MSRLSKIIGFDARRAWSSRDPVLGAIAGIAMLWAVVAFLGGDTDFDQKLGFASVAVALACCGVSHNRLGVFIGSLGCVALQSWFAVITTRDVRVWYLAIVATVIVIILLYVFRNSASREKS